MLRLVSALSVAVLALSVSAQTPNSRERSRPTRVDDKFVTEALNGGKFEVEICRMALRQSTDDDVKKLAQKMIAAHTECNQELQRIAQSRNISVSSQPDPIHAAIIAKLSSERGDEFDECFLCNQVLCHEAALICFRKEAHVGQDPELKEFAKKALPKLRDHLQMARRTCRYAQDGDMSESLKPNANHKDGR